MNKKEDHDGLGAWFWEDEEQLKTSFRAASPFPHLVIDNFLEDTYASEVAHAFPTADDTWHEYCNPIEVKKSRDDLSEFPVALQSLFRLLGSDTVLDKFQTISGIEERLQTDPTLHGAGLHAYPRYGRLNIHLDYEKHPILQNKERRLNLILFLNRDWDAAWGGANELWDDPRGRVRKKTDVRFNRAILFRTNNISWHGVPDIIRCPPGVHRRSVAFYYISDLTARPHFGDLGDDGTGYRRKAMFVRHPCQRDTEALRRLLQIRPLRRIERADVDPGWTPETSPDRYDGELPISSTAVADTR